MKCNVCDNNDKCLDRAKYDLAGCTSGIPGEVFTNYDRIRNMTDEEMAKILFSSCIDFISCDDMECSESLDQKEISKSCQKCVLNWLRSEVWKEEDE